MDLQRSSWPPRAAIRYPTLQLEEGPSTSECGAGIVKLAPILAWRLDAASSSATSPKALPLSPRQSFRTWQMYTKLPSLLRSLEGQAGHAAVVGSSNLPEVAGPAAEAGCSPASTLTPPSRSLHAAKQQIDLDLGSFLEDAEALLEQVTSTGGGAGTLEALGCADGGGRGCRVLGEQLGRLQAHGGGPASRHKETMRGTVERCYEELHGYVLGFHNGTAMKWHGALNIRRCSN
ncbi:hypothetical protein HaLaN_22614 [Haematococcus lacustris]|uniref:Uncharacterized protein n=1 Tax=Haematococcus lacustris TaxID=44745 RepID=A0A699ZR23_HAELA|nr:hypothetical protein HaLaN_22614 [Haematococcus lacustris]